MDELNNTNTQGQETTGTENETKTYTQEEVDAMLQKETDRRVTAALKKQESKMKEAEKVAQMNATERFQYELDQREKAIAEKEHALALAEMKNTCAQILGEKGLSLTLVDFVVDEDADIANARIQTLEKAFKASVKAEVEKRLGSKAPTKNTNENETMTKEQFGKLSISQMQQLHDTDPELYNLFTA